KLGRFDCSTRGIRFGVKENQNALPFEIFQRHFFAFIGRKHKVGSLLAYFQHHGPPRPQNLFGSFRFSVNSLTKYPCFRIQLGSSALTLTASPAVKRAVIPNAMASSGIFS